MIIFFIVVTLFCSALWLFFLTKKKKVSSGNLHNLGRNMINRDTKSRSGDLDGSISDSNINSIDALAYKSSGDNKARSGDIQGAIADYNQAIQLKPDFAEAYYARGDNLAKLASSGIVSYPIDNTKAIADFDKAISLNPNLAEAYLARGNVKILSGNHQSAIADYNQAIAIEPELARAYNNRAIAKSSQGDTRAAIIDLRKAAELSKAQGDMILYQNTIDTIEYLQQ